MSSNTLNSRIELLIYYCTTVHLLIQLSVISHFCTNHKSRHIKTHYLNQHDSQNWTPAHSTIEIGHRTLDPPASNRKSVLIPIVQKGKSTLSITYKCRYTGVYRLFLCVFHHRYTLNMRRLRELVDRLNPALDMVAFFHQALNVAHKRGRVAADVDDPIRIHPRCAFD